MFAYVRFGYVCHVSGCDTEPMDMLQCVIPCEDRSVMHFKWDGENFVSDDGLTVIAPRQV